MDGANYVNVNVNSLGVKTLKYNHNGAKQTELPSNWTNTGLVYYIMYDGTDFVILNYRKSEQSSITVFSLDDGILNLTSSSTAADIVTAFGSQTEISNFITGLEEKSSVLYVIGNKISTVLCAYSVEGTTDTVDTIQLLLTDTKMLRTIALTRANSTLTYTSVAVTNESIGGGGSSITVEDDLTSDSHVNPPSVHAVSDALGQINTILSNILS